MPGLWALVDARNYEESKNFMLAGADTELIKAIDEYHRNVQARAYDILKAAEKNTTIYITAQYNMQGLPISESSTTSNNDFLIDVNYASGGAICSKLDETLPEGYTQAKASALTVRLMHRPVCSPNRHGSFATWLMSITTSATQRISLFGLPRARSSSQFTTAKATPSL